MIVKEWHDENTTPSANVNVVAELILLIKTWQDVFWSAESWTCCLNSVKGCKINITALVRMDSGLKWTMIGGLKAKERNLLRWLSQSPHLRLIQHSVHLLRMKSSKSAATAGSCSSICIQVLSILYFLIIQLRSISPVGLQFLYIQLLLSWLLNQVSLNGNSCTWISRSFCWLLI